MKKTNAVETRAKTAPFVWNRWFGLIFERFNAVGRLLVALFMMWFSMLLIYGITSNAMGEFYRFIFFLRHPIVIVLNVVTLVAATVHAFCWFCGERGRASAFLLSRKMSQGWISIFFVIIITVFLFWIILG